MSRLRQIAERLLRDRTFRRRLPKDFGGVPMIVSSAGGLKLLLKPMSEVDPDLFATAKSLVRQGDVVWDVGANVGLFATAAAALAGATGKVFAFEPDTTLISLLRKSAQGFPTHCAPLTVIPAGLAGATALRAFEIAKRARASNSLADYGNSQAGGIRESQFVACFAGDDCLTSLPPPPPPNVIKIDVEGAEIEVLAGIKRMLAEHRPALACEVAPQNSDAVGKILGDLNYVVFDAPRPLVSGSAIETAAWNTIAVPREKQAAFVDSGD